MLASQLSITTKVNCTPPAAVSTIKTTSTAVFDTDRRMRQLVEYQGSHLVARVIAFVLKQAEDGTSVGEGSVKPTWQAGPGVILMANESEIEGAAA